jgi:hypothetical protein
MRYTFLMIYFAMFLISLAGVVVSACLRKHQGLAVSIPSLFITFIALGASWSCANVSNGCAGE